MKVEEFKELLHKSRTYNDVEARAKLGALSTDEYWGLYKESGVEPKI